MPDLPEYFRARALDALSDDDDGVRPPSAALPENGTPAGWHAIRRGDHQIMLSPEFSDGSHDVRITLAGGEAGVLGVMIAQGAVFPGFGWDVQTRHLTTRVRNETDIARLCVWLDFFSNLCNPPSNRIPRYEPVVLPPPNVTFVSRLPVDLIAKELPARCMRAAGYVR